MQPWPPNISDSDMSFVLRLPRDMHLCRSSSPRLPWFLKLLPNPHVLLPFGKVQNPLCLPQKSKHVVLWPFWLRNVLRATTACTFSTSHPAKNWCVLHVLTWKCGARYKSVHFLNISTSKSGPRLKCFWHFYFQMCFGPQRRALFRDPSSQIPPEVGYFFTFFDVPQRRSSDQMAPHPPL